ncbi:MAG: hypothetical protein LBV04_10795 [Deferribacteraceae bacterium]|nr:hypothetical protein [Deferribacteraceae bacterium]
MFNSPIEAGQSPQAKLWQLLIGKKVLVAFSGGKDSLALLAYMLEHQAACGWEL